MIFWTSAEMSPEAAVAYRQIINRAEDEINAGLAQPSIDVAWSAWKWAFIAIIISPNLGVEYSERVRRDQKRNVLEFRLKIDFKKFTTSTLAHQVELFFEQLHRSVDLMAKWGMVEADLGFLHDLLRRVQSTMHTA